MGSILSELKTDKNVHLWLCECIVCREWKSLLHIAVGKHQRLQAENKKLKAELDLHRWIPVSERLPEDDAPVLIWLASGNVVQGIKSADMFRSDGKLWHSVTHWKPIILPTEPPPKEN